MARQHIESSGCTDLRLRATQRLTGRHDPRDEPFSMSRALGVLHQLASSPATAADALALLHELQVHQVELELQSEDLRGSRAEFEAELRRQLQLYDGAPAGLVTLDVSGSIHEINLKGAAQLGLPRDNLIGRPLGSFLASQSARALQAMIERVAAGSNAEGGVLEFADPQGEAIVVQACMTADPAGGRVLVALLDLRGRR